MDLEYKSRAIDEKMISNEKQCYNCQEQLRERSEIKTNNDALLKSGDEGALSRNLEDAEQRLADVRANAAVDKSGKSGTSPPKDSKLDDAQKEHNGHSVDGSQDPRNRCRSLPIEELSIHSQGDKIKTNNTSSILKC